MCLKATAQALTPDVVLQNMKDARVFPVFQHILTLSEQAKIRKACHQHAVDLDMDMSSDSTRISFLGMAERVRKVSLLSCKLWCFALTCCKALC